MPNTQDPLFSYPALKEKMEKDLDDISKIAQGLKGKLEALDKAVHEYLSFTNSLIVIFVIFSYSPQVIIVKTSAEQYLWLLKF